MFEEFEGATTVGMRLSRLVCPTVSIQSGGRLVLEFHSGLLSQRSRGDAGQSPPDTGAPGNELGHRDPRTRTALEVYR